MNERLNVEIQAESNVSVRVLEILEQTLNEPPADGLSLDLQLIDVVEDSFEVVEIVFALEEEFDVDIPDQEIRTVRTIGDLVGRLEKLTASRKAAQASGGSSAS